MKPFERYYLEISRQLEEIYSNQHDAIYTGGDWIAQALAADRWIYAFGTGHSHMMAEEIFYRAGGLVRSVPILDEDLMLHKQASRSTELERKEDYAKEIIARYPVQIGDVLILISNSGRNPVPIELAVLARQLGMKTIAITNFRHSQAYASRHSSGQRLMEVADLSIDNGGLPDDACITLPGMNTKVGPTSTIVGSFIINALVIQGIESAMEMNTTPEIYRSSNSDDDIQNYEYLKKYRQRICHL